MRIDRIITMASRNVALQMRVMVRSLRSVNCDLPVYVIPYRDQDFDLPAGCQWLADEEIFGWLDQMGSTRLLRKYLTLLTKDYQFVDSDIVFLRNPVSALEPYEGFVVYCTEWNKPGKTYRPGTRKIMSAHTSTWQSKVFNSGQHASSEALFGSWDELRCFIEQPELAPYCIHETENHDQTALNILSFLRRKQFVNLTMPPHDWESSWAGDYEGEFEHLWKDDSRKPLLIHYAGETIPYLNRPINRLFENFLTAEEAVEWNATCCKRLDFFKRKYAPVPLRRRAVGRAKRRFSSLVALVKQRCSRFFRGDLALRWVDPGDC
jgi:hypothetical protein